MLSDLPLLSLSIWVPIVGGLLVLMTGSDKNAGIARWMSLFISVITFLVTIPLYTRFDLSTAAMQFSERHEWIGAFNVFYHLGIDGISLPLILLTAFSTILVVAAGWEVIQRRVAQYMAFFLIMKA